VDARSLFSAKTFSGSGLREKDIVVLTLHRGIKVIPNPLPQRELLAGDRLLCFGKLELMRDMTPGKVRRKRRPVIKDLPELPVAEEVYKDSGAIKSITISATKDGPGYE